MLPGCPPSGGDHGTDQSALSFAGLGGLGLLLCRLTFRSPVLVLFWHITTKAKKTYVQKCRDKDEAEQAVHRSANVVNPRQQEKVPGRADSLKNLSFLYLKLKPITNLNEKWTCILSPWRYLAFGLSGSSGPESPLSQFWGSGGAGEAWPWGREQGDKE